MKTTTTRAMLVIVAVLLAVDVAVRVATPATAQPTFGPRPWCLGVLEGSVPVMNPGPQGGGPNGQNYLPGLWRVWSDGSVEFNQVTYLQEFTGWRPLID